MDNTVYYWLVVEPPLWKIWKSVGMMKFPIYGNVKNVPNHQPDYIWIIEYIMDNTVQYYPIYHYSYIDDGIDHPLAI